MGIWTATVTKKAKRLTTPISQTDGFALGAVVAIARCAGSPLKRSSGQEWWLDRVASVGTYHSKQFIISTETTGVYQPGEGDQLSSDVKNHALVMHTPSGKELAARELWDDYVADGSPHFETREAVLAYIDPYLKVV